MAFESKVKIPAVGEAISFDANGKMSVPDYVVIPYIRGDGIGQDITPVMLKVIDAAVNKAYSGQNII